MGDSTINDVNDEKLENTKVVCFRGTEVTKADMKDKIKQCFNNNNKYEWAQMTVKKQRMGLRYKKQLMNTQFSYRKLKP